jgi:hypothetical protein
MIIKYLFFKLSKLYKVKWANLSPYTVIEDQKKLIWRRGFDVLIILDACRYDVFEKVIHEYLDGELKAVVSPASVTIDWLKSVWVGVWKDVVYVSAAPMVNKRGLLKEFNAKDKFLDVVEVWDWGWDEDLITVPPQKVNLGVAITLANMKVRGYKFPRDYKLVVHYVQPHAPYRMLGNITRRLTKYESLKTRILDVNVRKLLQFRGDFSIDHILLGTLKDTLHGDEKVSKAIRIAYEDNLRWVLEHVSNLVTRVKGKVIITADHGELLGEYGLYFHMNLPLPELRIVPWFIVK